MSCGFFSQQILPSYKCVAYVSKTNCHFPSPQEVVGKQSTRKCSAWEKLLFLRKTTLVHTRAPSCTLMHTHVHMHCLGVLDCDCSDSMRWSHYLWHSAHGMRFPSTRFPCLSRLLLLCKQHGVGVTLVKVSMGIAVVSSADAFNHSPHFPRFP